MNTDAGIDAAISAFIRHPELGSIKYEGKDKLISMEMILKGYIDEKQKQQFIHKTNQALKLYYKLRNVHPDNLNVKVLKQSDITILTLIRDETSLSEEEIDIYVSLANQEFASLLLSETVEIAKDMLHYDVKRTVMERINKKWNSDNKVIAYRDRGKMFVYDK